MYIKHCKLSSYKQLKLLEHFVAGTPARTAADLVGSHCNSVICGKVEVDESYFGGVHKGKRGCGAAGKTIVFGLLKRGGNVLLFPSQMLRETPYFL